MHYPLRTIFDVRDKDKIYYKCRGQESEDLCSRGKKKMKNLQPEWSLIPKELLSSYSVQSPESLHVEEKKGKVIAILELRGEVIYAE